MLGRWSGEWHVIDQHTRRSLESHATEGAANRAAGVLNAHERQQGRPARYIVEHRPAHR